MTQADRFPRYDILRFFGLMLIILAHCEPPAWLSQLRNFDVPLLIVVSAMTYGRLYRDRLPNPLEFLKKRLIRLIVPAWLFLSLFFLIVAGYGAATATPFPYSSMQIITSYAFYSGIGYVWILKVFVIIALLTPPMLYLRTLIRNDTLYFSVLIAAYAAYELVVFLAGALITHEKLLEVVENTILIAVPYALLYAYGLKIEGMSRRALFGVSIGAFTLCALYAFYIFTVSGTVQETQIHKYPPQIYYLSFSLGALTLAYMASGVKGIEALGMNRFVAWASQNSLWIYLWHILTLFIWDKIYPHPMGGLGLCLAKYAFILAASFALTWVHLGLARRLIPLLPERIIPAARVALS